MFTRISTLAVLLLSLNASASEFKGVWVGECAKGGDTEFPTQDVLVFREDGLLQYSLTFKGRKECDQPSVTTRLDYRGSLTPSKLKKGSLEFAIKPAKIELIALNAAGAMWLIEKRECDKDNWNSRQPVDCTQKEPYKTFVASQKFRLLFSSKGEKIEYRDVSDGLLNPKAKAELFTAAPALPYDLEKLPK